MIKFEFCCFSSLYISVHQIHRNNVEIHRIRMTTRHVHVHSYRERTDSHACWNELKWIDRSTDKEYWKQLYHHLNTKRKEGEEEEEKRKVFSLSRYRSRMNNHSCWLFQTKRIRRVSGRAYIVDETCDLHMHTENRRRRRREKSDCVTNHFRWSRRSISKKRFDFRCRTWSNSKLHWEIYYENRN